MIGLGLLAIGCTAVRPVPDEPDRAYLELRVEPKTAEVYVDGEYRGKVDRWVERTVPLDPGDHRVKLVADGYMTRRLDVAVPAGRKRVLELEMEPTLTPGGVDDENETPDRRDRRGPRPGGIEDVLDR